MIGSPLGSGIHANCNAQGQPRRAEHSLNQDPGTLVLVLTATYCSDSQLAVSVKMGPVMMSQLI